ncbi:MAG: glycosyltransferase family 39 protein [Thermoguttaceae bacterium]|nr:glycosyltransferase family 39 protein [Thermoguttaceae bacterium]
MRTALVGIAGSVFSERRLPLWVCSLLAVHAGLLAWSAARQSPTVDEPFHLAAGIEHWHFGQFNIDRGNPPLVGSVAALPVLAANPRTDWSRAPNSYAVGSDFVAANGSRTFWLTTLGRWACIPFSLLGAYVCFHWAWTLYGHHAGLVALALWCFCPNMLAHGQLITGDMAATAAGVAAFYVFWRWLREPSLGRAVAAGTVLGLAELSKFVWLVLYPLWPAVWVARRLSCRRRPQRLPFWREAGHMAIMVLLSLYVINLGYAFESPLEPLGDFHAGKKLLGAIDGSSWAARALASVPVPLPANYVRGIDEILRIGEGRPWTYLGGQRRPGGWWYFYPYAVLVKTPLGTLVLLELACVLSFVQRYSAGWKNEWFLLFPIVVLLAFVEGSGTSKVLRYVLPIFPFAFIWASKAGRSFAHGDRLFALLAAGSLSWAIGSSLSVYPHSLSYFNALAGGPQGGHAHLVNSDIDWGQDLLYLKRWLDEHPDARPLHLAYFGRVDPLLAGIDYTLPPKCADARSQHNAASSKAEGPQPGWHAVSVNLLRGFGWDVPDGKGGVEWLGGAEYAYLLRVKPVAMAGYSIYIYCLDVAEANRLRAQLGLPLFSMDRPQD